MSLRDDEKLSTNYEILVRSHVGEQLATDLGAQRFEVSADRTLLVVGIIDQSHLHGVIGRLGDLNIEIERVNPV